MRTTIDIPDELAREAKLAAIRRGTTLRDLFTKALARELYRGQEEAAKPRLVDFPLIRPDRGTGWITSSEVLEAELDDDIRRSVLPR